MSPKILSFFFILFAGLFCFQLQAQPTWTFDPFGREKKPEEFKEKKLGSEKTADKKFTKFRRFTQNTISHYNFYFNANNKINTIIENARAANKDDYTKLLAFYPYSMENTASQQVELDSVIYKATAGILLHDLRTDWVDNMYLLIGKAYFFRKTFDTAALTFQFINYNLFPRKKGEDDSRVVGGNVAASGSMLSIADKEKRNLMERTFTIPQSRNDALIWLARTYIEAGDYSEASSLINILHNDSNVPERLKDDLEEMSAYLFYKQEMYDSAAPHLEKAITNAASFQDKSRWQFLLAQLYEINHSYGKASEYYALSAKNTTDALMDIFAHLNDAKMASGNGDTKEVDANIADLLKMAKKDKYEAYRDIVYNSAGQLALQKPDTTNAEEYFKQSIKYSGTNMPYRNKSFLSLANISYNQRDYKNAKSYYDSVNVSDPSVVDDTAFIESRKSVLGKVVSLIAIINKEDSVQKIALMKPADRDALIKQMVKKYKKDNSIPEDNSGGSAPISFSNQPNTSIDLFSSTAKGDWYFYNANLKAKGYSDFKTQWGKRANTDNWRRKAAADVAIKNINANINVDAVSTDTASTEGKSGADKLVPFSFDALMADIPLTKEQLDSSNARIASSMLALALVFRNELLDYAEAIRVYEEYLDRFKGKPEDAEVYLGLSYCYGKIGDNAKAEYYKNQLLKEYAGSKSAAALTNPQSLQETKQSIEETKKYEKIYGLFMEGKFAEALSLKKSTDSVLGKSYWTPQLLYIEAVYYVHERKDSLAIAVLNDIVSLYPQSSLKEKAERLADVVSRRAEIESYLSNLQVSRVEEEKIIISEPKQVVVQKSPDRDQQVQIKSMQSSNRTSIALDSIKNIPSMENAGFLLQPDKPHMVAMLLEKVDAVYVNEVVNAFNRFDHENPLYKNVVIKKDVLDGTRSLLLFSTFDDSGAALEYFEKLKKSAPSSISWLQPSKYSFIIITENNLKLLKENKDLNGYKTLLNSQYSNKF